MTILAANFSCVFLNPCWDGKLYRYELKKRAFAVKFLR